jgi:hypothetical protein
MDTTPAIVTLLVCFSQFPEYLIDAIANGIPDYGTPVTETQELCKVFLKKIIDSCSDLQKKIGMHYVLLMDVTEMPDIIANLDEPYIFTLFNYIITFCIRDILFYEKLCDSTGEFVCDNIRSYASTVVGYVRQLIEICKKHPELTNLETTQYCLRKSVKCCDISISHYESMCNRHKGESGTYDEEFYDRGLKRATVIKDKVIALLIKE